MTRPDQDAAGPANTAPGTVPDPMCVNIACSISACPERAAAALIHEVAEVDKENRGERRRCHRYDDPRRCGFKA